MEILRFFEFFFNILSKFSRKFMGEFRKFWKYAFVGGSEPDPPPPESSEIIKKLVAKSIETCKILKIFMNF